MLLAEQDTALVLRAATHHGLAGMRSRNVEPTDLRNQLTETK